MKKQYDDVRSTKDVNKLVAFLKSLNGKQKKELANVLEEKREKENLRGMNIKDVAYIGAALVCSSGARQFNRLTEIHYDFNMEELDEVLAFHVPKWFEGYLNKDAESSYSIVHLTYDTVLRWFRKGFVHPCERRIATSLSYAHGVGYNVLGEYNLEKDPIILDEHIWLLFKQIDWLDISSNGSRWDTTKKENSIWSEVFIRYTGNGRLDRMRVLRECLQTVNAGFKKDLQSEFAELFERLTPKNEELIQLQPELFGCLASPTPHMINTSLAMLSRIAGRNEFLVDEFLLQLPILLISKPKKVILATLDIIEQIAQENAAKREEALSASTMVFLNKEETIQKIAANLLMKYPDAHTEAFKKALSQYNKTLLTGTKTILNNLLTVTPQPGQVVVQQTDTTVNPLCEENKIPLVESWDDYIFYLSQVFIAPEAWQLERLPGLINRFSSQVNETNAGQLEIPLRKAYEIAIYANFALIRDGFYMYGGSGIIRHLYSIYFIEYGEWLAQQYPRQMSFVQAYHEEVVGFDKSNLAKSKDYWIRFSQFSNLKDWYCKKYPVYTPLHQQLLYAWELLQAGKQIELLSTPTHAPCWIDEQTFIHRLKQLNKEESKPDVFDLQLALERVVVTDKERFFEELTREVGSNYIIPAVKQHIEKYSWHVGKDKEKTPDWSQRYPVEVIIPDNPWKDTNTIYSSISEKTEPMALDDFPRYLQLFPQTTGTLFARYMSYLRYSQVPNADTRDILLSMIRAFHELKPASDPLTDLFLAACMLCSEKGVRDYAVAIWTERTTLGTINNESFGTIMGELLNGEWAVVKRLTDIILTTLLHISEHQNRELEKMVSGILSKINKPVTNLKKLLEIYRELLSLNHHKADIIKIPQLKEWATDKKLKGCFQDMPGI